MNKAQVGRLPHRAEKREESAYVEVVVAWRLISRRQMFLAPNYNTAPTMAYPILSDFDPTEHTLPGILDYYAHFRPDAVFAEYPLSQSTYSQGYRKITYHDMANAVNGVARWLIQNLEMGNGSTKLAYIGPNDMRYNVLTLASIKAGYSVCGLQLIRIE
ncbi:hypothetical protein AtubIFM57258_002869 [Aspergillus tubingensis]|nr:hypothetical protein AtubIFM57258_002869 [Aspergillus tubingensis]